jgi:hypothetical protein
MNILQIILIGIGSVVIPTVFILGLIGLAIMTAVVVDELFEDLFKH